VSFRVSAFSLVLSVFGLVIAVADRSGQAVSWRQWPDRAEAMLFAPRSGVHRDEATSRSAVRRRAATSRHHMETPLPPDGQPIGTTFFAKSALARKITAASPPLDPHSAAMVEAVSAGGLGQMQFDRAGNGGTAVSTGHRSDPVYTPQCLESYGLPGRRHDCPVVATHIRAGATAGVPTDYHSAFLDASNDSETDAWLTCATDTDGNLKGNPCRFPLLGPLTIGWGASGSRAGDGTGFGGTASGIALTPGIVRAEDLLAGVATHGFLVAVQCGASQANVYPSKGTDAQGSSTCTGATAEPTYGQILWLDATGESEMLSMNPVVLGPYIRAWHDYGAYIGDKNEAGAVSKGSDVITMELENSPAWLRVVSAIRRDRHRIDTTMANRAYHLNPRVPSDFVSHLHVLSAKCSEAGC